MNEGNQKTKAKKIIIAVIAVIAVLAIIFGILVATGKFNLNFSKRSKMSAGVEKLEESITKPLDKISDEIEKNGVTPKVVDSIDKDSAIEASTEISANIDTLEVSSLSSSEQSTMDSIVKMANKSKIGLNLKYDGNKSAYAKINGNIDNTAISGEAVYDGNQAAIRSEELNSKWITISKDDLKDLLDENNLDIDELEKILSETNDQISNLMKSVNVDQKTQKEIRKRYTKVFKDFIKEKSKNLKSESDTVKVDGKNKKCKKITLELSESDIKELINNYLDTFAKDDQLKGILNDSASAYSEIIKSANSSLSGTDELENIADSINTIYDNIDTLKEKINDLDFEGNLKVVSYATNTKVYRTDLSIEIEGTEIILKTLFNKDTTEMTISANSQGASADIATITSKNNEISVKAEASKMLAQQIGTEASAEINYKTQKSKSEITLSVNAGDYGKGTISAVTDISKNEDKNYEDTTTLNVDIDSQYIATAKMTITAKNNLKVGNVSIPQVSTNDGIDIKDETSLSSYMKDAQSKAQEILKKLEPIIEEFSKSSSSNKTNKKNNTPNITEDDDTDEDDTSDITTDDATEDDADSIFSTDIDTNNTTESSEEDLRL